MGSDLLYGSGGLRIYVQDISISVLPAFRNAMLGLFRVELGEGECEMDGLDGLDELDLDDLEWFSLIR